MWLCGKKKKANDGVNFSLAIIFTVKIKATIFDFEGNKLRREIINLDVI